MRRSVFLVVPAGGRGLRMGSETPKQFLELRGKAILQRTIENFASAVPGIKVVTVLPQDYLQPWKEYCLKRNFTLPQKLVAGGLTRFHSVRNALAGIPDGATVMIHDGVRPLVSAGLIRRMLSRFEEGDLHALIPVMPETDTLKSLEEKDGKIIGTGAPDPDRSKVWRAQTPQIFRSEDIKAAYSQAYNPAFTDDASVADAKKIPLAWIEGERFNIKITTPDDLPLAEFILGAR
jgi:2-C-methyl-D-erythritol 4-phosphate cytidylyltransferase